MVSKEDVIGVFIGLESASYEYIATIIAPYNSNFSIRVGDFLLIENTTDYIVSRVTEYRPTGELMSFMGQKWLGDVSNDVESIGLDIKERKIRYTVKIKILGSIKNSEFKPGVSTIPHITSKVIKPDVDQIKTIINAVNDAQQTGTEIGNFYMDQSIRIKFNVKDLNSKRTFIFARAGYGKSNLMKLMANAWPKGEGGLLIFDPEGEYAMGNKKAHGITDSRPAIVIKNRNDSSNKTNVYRHLKINLKDLDPELVLPIIINPAKHDTIFFSKLMGMNKQQWSNLVDYLSTNKFKADVAEIGNIVVGKADDQNMQPVINNLVPPISKMHDEVSNLLNIITQALIKEEVVIFDISLLDSHTALQLSSLIIKYIFNENQRHFTDENTEPIKATFVVEEAQSVLDGRSGDYSFIELAKEGRKYELGAIFITQQPGSIPFDILSQADNFFVFHLLSKGDLESLKKANAHYSDDILTQILSEPIKGKCYMWTSSQPFVIPVKIDSFDDKVNKAISNGQVKTQDLIGPILEDIRHEDAIMLNIRAKFQDVDKSDKDVSEKTKELYQLLDDNEKEYLRKNSNIQQGVGGKEFAVKTRFYNSLSK